jgi:LAS superfamily LD-carboxypeptidase LdcB
MQKILNKRAVFSASFSLLLIAVVVFLTAGRSLSPQAQTLPVSNVNVLADSKTEPKLTAEVTKTASTRPVMTNSSFSSAISLNTNYKSSLRWIFGGKTQRGWCIYEPLIGQLINANSQAQTSEFASALSNWQKSVGLESSGVLDETSWSAMIKTWQSQRLKNLAYASPDTLITAPASEFWDASRPAELRQVERETYAAYKKMLAAAIADKSLNLATNPDGTLAESEKFLKIVSAFRSREYQLKLRKAEPNASTAALAIHSPHFTGRALDLYVGGLPTITKDENRLIQINTPVYKWLVKNAAKYGFRPYFYEPWHWEYVGVAANK